MAGRISRRQLGMAAFAGAAFGQTAAPAKYTGALDGFESTVDLASFDPVQWTKKRCDAMPRKLEFKAGNRKQSEAWQKKLHAKLLDLVGGFPAERTPLAAQTLEVKEYPKYRREKFVITTRPGLSLLGYVMTPKERTAPHPAMICIPGHGRGVDDIVGIDEAGRDRTDKAGYQHDFAIQAVEHGMAAIAIEPMAFGCRRGVQAKRRTLGTSSCQPTAGAALLLGETMVGWRVWDVMRVVDWIETRKELDSKRVGCMGISGGGTITVFATALEPRIK